MKIILNRKNAIKCRNCDDKLWSRKGDKELCYGCSPAESINNELTYVKCGECKIEYTYNRYQVTAAILGRYYSAAMDNCPVCYRHQSQKNNIITKYTLWKWKKLLRLFVREKQC